MAPVLHKILQYRAFSLSWPVFYWGLCLVCISLPVSPYFTSVGQFLMLGCWLVEGRFREKWETLKTNKPALAIMSIYLLHVIAMFYTTDIEWGMHDLKIKLPLLSLPLMLGSYQHLNRLWVKRALGLFVATLWVASFIGLAYYMGITGSKATDYRQISVFISHIRLALMFVLAVFISFWMVAGREFTLKWYEKAGYSLSVVWFIVFIFILRSGTGMVVVALAGTVMSVFYFARFPSKTIRIAGIILSLLPLSLAGIYVYHVAKPFLYKDKPVLNPDKLTTSGNLYTHHYDLQQYENGHIVGEYICEPELRVSWNLRSTMHYDSCRRNGYGIKYTLFRYMASKNLRKDAEGLARLSDEDIKKVEAGNTNYLFTSRWSIFRVVYEVVWQIDSYWRTSVYTGHSVSQRFEYWKVAGAIIGQYFWFGTGTGDVVQAYRQQYETINSPLPEDLRLRAHNQYITIWVSFGIVGFIWFILAYFFIILVKQNYADFLIAAHFCITSLSMLNEDTLETQAGITFFVLFFCLFIFRGKSKNDD